MPHSLPLESAKGRSGNERLLLSVVVDEDESLLESLPDLRTNFGLAARVFSSPEERLALALRYPAAMLLVVRLVLVWPARIRKNYWGVS